MPLSSREKNQLREEHWDPAKTVESFAWAVQRWCEDFDSTRAGVLALLQRMKQDRQDGDPKVPTYDTLRRYADGALRDPKMGGTAIPVLRSILR